MKSEIRLVSATGNHNKPTDAVHTSINYKLSYIYIKNKESSEESHLVQSKTKLGINMKIQFIKQAIYWQW